MRLAAALALLLMGSAGVARGQTVVRPSDGDLVVEPALVDFGNVDRDVRLTRDVKVTHAGHRRHGADIHITAVNLPDTPGCAPFQLQPGHDVPIAMMPGEDVTWRVTLRATAVGHHTCTIDIADNDSNADSISLSATVVGPLMTVQPGAIDFGDVTVHDEAIQRISITNDGTAPLAVRSIEASGSVEFVLSGLTAPAVIPAHTTQVVTVTYRPSAASVRTGTVTISGDGGTISVPLAGTGTTTEGAGYPADTDVSTDPTSYYACSYRGPTDAGGLAGTALVVLILLRRRHLRGRDSRRRRVHGT